MTTDQIPADAIHSTFAALSVAVVMIFRRLDKAGIQSRLVSAQMLRSNAESVHRSPIQNGEITAALLLDLADALDGQEESSNKPPELRNFLRVIQQKSGGLAP